MKLNIAYPATGCQKCIEIEDEKKLRALYDKRMSQEVSGDELGDQFKGYVFKIMGGNDKQGFPMKQGVLTNTRVRLLLAEGTTCYRPRRKGERKRKSVRGCIVGPDISVVHLVVIKKGDEEVEGLTDKYIPRRLGPKRASKIRKLFNLSKEDDVRKYVIRREITPKEGKPAPKKPKTKAPKIQRLVTPQVLQRRRHVISLKKRRAEKSKREAAEYAKLLQQRSKERADRKRRESISKKRQRDSQKKDQPTSTTTSTTTSSSSSTSSKAIATPVKGATTATKPAVKQTAVATKQAKATTKPPTKTTIKK